MITVVGDDRPGLVSALADVIAQHSGSWERSQLAELAGKFAGIVTVDVPEDRASGLAEALGGLTGVLDTTVHTARPQPERSGEGEVLHLDLIGNDRPGIIQEITAALTEQQVSVEDLQTKVVPTPQAGGDLFAARARLRVPDDADLPALRGALERIAQELMVDLSFEPEDDAGWE
ncbi:Glycine cleavage system transcriptional antiactivator GcvR [Serinicoccus hydrothermalis]|uniref:Glycine cleavage system transcriptional antiactivator GcvR n=1 Tax=Serinicoccus hydrothermalis TaxID=1758689 RepID=A0A1B1NGC3_9MICO|nr:Glycine cleavage system transcriptional antiactivator GcvR [Serinicoccus hydrothermalis]